ncbi:MAG: hypothetical protein J3K34DRAFT_412042 [Monoraphidium minutum]|nr:MAG: hypothetical protein J3K34DRAFT_412042 [Monoraphidium minutum]
MASKPRGCGGGPVLCLSFLNWSVLIARVAPSWLIARGCPRHSGAGRSGDASSDAACSASGAGARSWAARCAARDEARS